MNAERSECIKVGIADSVLSNPRLSFSALSSQRKRVFGVIMDRDNHTAVCKSFTSLGATYDGRQIGLSRGKWALLVLCLFMISPEGGCAYEQLASVIDIASHAFLYRRCLFISAFLKRCIFF